MTHNGLGGSAYSIELYVREIFILPILLDAARGLVAWAVRPAGVAPAKITSTFGDIHARVPIVTVDEQRALQPENATADADQRNICFLDD